MESILLKANAKINWTLKVVGRREDGYHDLDMLLSSVTLYDRVRITRVPFKGIKLQTYGRFVLNGEKNIAYKAAERFYSELGERAACRIDIQKHIPVCAGMGGGSADAAAALYGLNELYGRPFSGGRAFYALRGPGQSEGNRRGNYKPGMSALISAFGRYAAHGSKHPRRFFPF